MHGKSPQLSVVIPTINEADSLPTLLDQLGKQQGITLDLIVADGGSSDATQKIAEQLGAKLVVTEPGRGHQMNQGAGLASAPLLLFLHADSSLTSHNQLALAVNTLRKTQEQLGHERVAGHFRLRFQRSLPGHELAYRYYEEKSALNLEECTNGDQGFLLARCFFEELGGFDESLWFLEDQRLAETIRRQSQWITLPGVLATSARRFEQEGLGRRLLLSALIMNFHAMGLSEFFHRAAAVYRNQDRTGKLRLGPIFNLIDELNREAGRQVSHQRWLATGRYVFGHVWQLFFWLDVALEHRFDKRKRIFLPFYDRFIGPLVDWRPFHVVTAGLTWLWFVSYRWWLNIKGG
ncbi:MAG: TIGR04283 family arsenosugar biosynthesis glycosyltransferase [Pseudomonadota bacterium]